MALSSGFGSRYGRKVRRKYDVVAETYKFKKQVCPYCGMKKVSRLASGVFDCEYCGKKFSGGAYEAETRMGKTLKSTVGKSTKLTEKIIDQLVLEEEKGEAVEVEKPKKKPKKEKKKESEE